uniref:MYND-type domain-containing protein n=1 Tax=Panagrolaimus superbus TaxID=310955 RepID=A0A914XYG3_9BILA
MEFFVVQVHEQIEDDKKRDIQAITDEALVLAEAHRIGLHAEILDSHNNRIQQLRDSMEEYYAPKLDEAKQEAYCSANGCKNERKIRCCFFAFYCSEACQIGHWKSHLKECNREEFLDSSDTVTVSVVNA